MIWEWERWDLFELRGCSEGLDDECRLGYGLSYNEGEEAAEMVGPVVVSVETMVVAVVVSDGFVGLLGTQEGWSFPIYEEGVEKGLFGQGRPG